MKTVRFGVVGLGVIGLRHAHTILRARSRQFALAALAETVPAVADRAAGQFDVPVFRDPHEMFRSGLCDAVIVAVPHCWHPVLTVAAARAGLHVLCEKPLAVTVGPARVMIEQCRRHKVALGVMLQDRTLRTMRTMKRMIDAGELGAIYRVAMTCSRWYRTQAYYDSGAWRGTWDGEGGGVLLNQAPHSLDLFQWLGGMPRHVLAACSTRLHRIEVENTAEAVFQYDDGRTGHFYASTAHAPGTERIEVLGDKGTLLAEGGRLRFGKLDVPMAEHVRTCKTAMADDIRLGATWRNVPLPAARGGGHVDVIAAFAAHILHGEPMVATGEEGLNELELSNAIYLSAFNNRPVELPVDADEIERLLGRLTRQRSTGRGGGQRAKAAAALRRVLGASKASKRTTKTTKSTKKRRG